MDFKTLLAGFLAVVSFLMLAACQRGEDKKDVALAQTQDDAHLPVEYTLSIIKPNAVADDHIGAIIDRFERSGLKIAAMRMVHLSQDQAQQFYAVHKDRPFFKDLVQFMTSGPVVVMVLEGPNAVQKNREVMGATDPKKAAKGSIRADFAKSLTENAVHGSDAPETAKDEIAFFFKPQDIIDRQ